MNTAIPAHGRLISLASLLLFCFALRCLAADKPTVLVVAYDGSHIFYIQGDELAEIEEVPKGTELTIESMSGERCFVTYKGRPAYIRRQFLVTREEFLASERAAKGLIEYEGQWVTPEDRKATIQSNLFAAVAKGDSDKLAGTLKTDPSLINATNSEGESLLQFAITRQNEKIARVLLENRAGIDVPGKGGITALDIAAGNGSTNCINLLLAKGADVNSKAESGATPLLTAVAADHIEAVTLLLRHGARLDVADANGYTASQLAVKLGEPAIADLLHKEEASNQLARVEAAKQQAAQASKADEKQQLDAAVARWPMVRGYGSSRQEFQNQVTGMTKAQLLDYYGRPDSIQRSGTSIERWSYSRLTYDPTTGKRDDMTQVTFEDGTVTGVFFY